MSLATLVESILVILFWKILWFLQIAASKFAFCKSIFHIQDRVQSYQEIKCQRFKSWSLKHWLQIWSVIPKIESIIIKRSFNLQRKKNSEAEYLFLCPRRSTIVRPRTSSSMQKLLRQNQGSESSSQIQGKAEFDSNCGQNCSTPEIKFLSPRPCHLIMGADFFDVFQLSIDSGIWSRNSCALTVIYRAESF